MHRILQESSLNRAMGAADAMQVGRRARTLRGKYYCIRLRRLWCCRSLEIATGQARQYNLMLESPSIPQETLQQLLQDSISPSMLKNRRSMQGCRIAMCVLHTCTVVVTAGGGRGEHLAARFPPRRQQFSRHESLVQAYNISV